MWLLHVIQEFDLLTLVQVNLFLHFEVCRDGSSSDRELQREATDLVQFKLSVDFLCNLWHVLKVQDVTKRLNDGLQEVAIIVEVLRVIILFQKFKEKLGDLV